MKLPRLSWLLAANILMALLLWLVLSTPVDAQTRTCFITGGMENHKAWWHISLADSMGHKFLLIQTGGTVDTAFATCKVWLKKGKKPPKPVKKG